MMVCKLHEAVEIIGNSNKHQNNMPEVDENNKINSVQATACENNKSIQAAAGEKNKPTVTGGNSLSSNNTPIYTGLRKYAEEIEHIFHMPGHKLGRGIPEEFSQNLLQLDVTEVEGTDNLHFPEGIIRAAQHQAAKAFGADETFFLVNGSSCGVQAAILSVCARGQKIIVGRDSHKSVVSGLVLSGAEPVFVYPEFNEEFAIAAQVTPESIEKALGANPDACAVLITRPNYYGICSDIEKISSLVHAHGKPLIVDEAHGAHFAFSDRLPQPALLHGADICIQSAHKTLPAVTQGAYLHVKGNRVDRDRLALNLSMLQTSSPSYIIMASLDIARDLMEREGSEKLEALIGINEQFACQLEKEGIYKVLSSKNMGINAIQDPTRLVINVSGLGISGYHTERILREKYRIQVEMADFENIVLITTVADTQAGLQGIYEALTELAAVNSCAGQSPEGQRLRSLIKTQYSKGENKNLLSPWEAYVAAKEELELERCSGRLCAQTITPYPPGIPYLYPGEIIDPSGIEYIKGILAAGGKVNGVGNKNTIRVIKTGGPENLRG